MRGLRPRLCSALLNGEFDSFSLGVGFDETSPFLSWKLICARFFFEKKNPPFPSFLNLHGAKKKKND